MRVQVLVATMDQVDHSLLDRMNIQSDAIICNQCNQNKIEEIKYNEHHIKWMSFDEHGVGLNRNNALMRADAEICLFADDDMKYVDNYKQILIDSFTENPKADVIIFNLKEEQPKRFIINKKTNINYFNYLRYGTARIAVRLNKIKQNGIYFNQCFGGGTEHCHGEDNIFLHDCLKKGLKLIAIPKTIAMLTEDRESSWNNGYNEKYLLDQGVLYKTLSKRWWRLLCLQDAIRRCKSYNLSWWKAYSLMIKGVKQFNIK